MTGGLDRAWLAAVKTAALLHDPPWKPWGIAQSGYQLEGCQQEKRFDACIARSVVEELGGHGDAFALCEKLCGESNPLKDLCGLGLSGEQGGRGGGCRDVESGLGELAGRLVEGLRREAEAYLREPSGLQRSHERQAVLLLRLLAGGLEAAGLEEAARVFRRAAGALEGADSRAKRIVDGTDVLASSIDRALLSVVDPQDRLAARRQVYVNIFNPGAGMEVGARLSVNRVVGYIFLLGLTLAVLLQRAGKRGAGIDPMLVYGLLYSLYEPLWYLATGPRYAPVADTRVPHHTVFDHAAATAMAVNWLLGGKPGGCLVIVDLKSVQGWIAESRRLRDLWASSWLASYLAWAAVKPLVEELGPDILIQPPARLHPFYSAWLLGRLGCSPGDQLCRAAAALLGLPRGWPLDPTVPSMVRLALPEQWCSNARDLASRIEDNYREAWRGIMESLVDGYLEPLVSTARGLQAAGSTNLLNALVNTWNQDNVKGLLKGLEPPLPLSIEVRRVADAWSMAQGAAGEARRLLQNRLGQSTDIPDLNKLTRMLLYQVLSDNALWPRRFCARASGRRSGKSYHELVLAVARYGLRTGSRTFYNCHVCGAAAAIVDGAELQSVLGRASKSLQRLVSNLQGERLCPYCLVKRMLRDMLYHDGLAEKLVGMEMPKEVYDRLGRVSTDAFTSRMRLNKDLVEEAAQEVLDSYHDALIWLKSRGMVPPNTYAWLLRPGKERSEDVVTIDDAEALVVQALHDYAFPDALEEEAGRVGDRQVAEKLRGLAKKLRSLARKARGRRTYAVVLSDGDRMGSGVLAGVLGLGPVEYAEKVLEAAGLDEKHRSIMAEAMDAVIDAYTGYVRCRTGGGVEKKTTIVTPSYAYSVSRALAVQAVLDRDAVERLQGMFLYSGGDDAAAVLPPVELWDGRIAFPALAAAVALRRLYWGLEPLPQGARGPEAVRLQGLRTGLPDGFNAVTAAGRHVAIVPALAAYGRSTVVYYAGVKEPFWRVFGEAHEILDEKDKTVFELPGLEKKEKDALFAVGSAGASVLPLAPLTWRQGQPPDPRAAAAVWAAAELLRLATPAKDGGDGVLSASVLADARGYAKPAYLAAKKCRSGTARRLLLHVAGRNLVKQAMLGRVENRVGVAEEGLGGDTCISSYASEQGSVLARYLADGFTVKDDGMSSSSLFQVVNTARVTRSAV